LFLKPTVIGGDKLQDDYEVLDENRTPIGRIMLHPQGPQGRPWFWGNNKVPNLPGHDRGFAESREQAMADFKMASRPWSCAGREGKQLVSHCEDREDNRRLR
jgi:hypothetical protein